MSIITTTKTLRPRHWADFYPTPRPFADETVRVIAPLIQQANPFMLDPGAGDGIFGDAFKAVYPGSVVCGTDLRPLSRPRSYDYWYTGGYDFSKRPRRREPLFDVVIGNPPYNKAEEFVRLGLSLLTPGGVLAYLLRLAFLEGQDRGADLYECYPPRKVWVCSERPSFTGDGNTDATAYAVLVWQDGWQGETTMGWLAPSRMAQQLAMPLLLEAV